MNLKSHIDGSMNAIFSPNLRRRSQQNVYDYVESEKVYRFLTTNDKVIYDANKSTNMSSIFDKSPKMYRRFKNLEKYNDEKSS